MEVRSCRFHVFYLVVNGARAKNVQDVLKVFDDVNDVGAIRQGAASNQGGASQDDQYGKLATTSHRGETG